MLGFVNLLTLLLILVTNNFKSVNGSVPTIQVIDSSVDRQWGRDWEVVDLGNDETNILAKHNQDLILAVTCTDLDPVCLNIDLPPNGLEGSKHIKQCDRPVVTNSTTFMRSSVFTFRPNSSSMVELVRCTSLRDTRNSTVNVFIRGEYALLNSGKTIEYAKDNQWIPCITADPKKPVFLHMVNKKSGALEKVNATYSVTKGFFVENPDNEDFICSAADGSKVNFVPQRTVHTGGSDKKREFTKPKTSISTVEIRDAEHGMSWKKDWEIYHSDLDLQSSTFLKTMFPMIQRLILIVSKNNRNLFLHMVCSSADEIEWTVQLHDGELNPPAYTTDCDDLPRMVNATEVYYKSLTVNFTESVIHDLIHLQCMEKKFTSVSEVFVFFPKQEGTHLLLDNGKTLPFDARYPMINCSTADPRVPVYLWFEDPLEGTMKQIKNASYLPPLGFYDVELIRGGVYVCKSGENDTVRFIDGNEIEEYFLIYETDVTAHCPNADLAEIIYQRPDYTVDEEWNDFISPMGSYYWMKFTGRKHFKKIPITYEKGAHKPREIDIYCVKYENISSVKYKGIITNNWIVTPILEKPFVVPEYQRSYFAKKNSTVLSRSLLHWDNFSNENIIRLKPLDKRVFHTNTNATFACMTQVKRYNVSFWLEYSNNSITQIQNGSFKSVVFTYMDMEKIKVTGLQIEIPASSVGISCKVSAVPASLFYSTEQRFITKDIQSPKIIVNTTSYHFYTGQSNRQIVCFAKGEPQPIYNWTKNLTNLDTYKDFEITTGENAATILTFLKIKESDSGTYACSASNQEGKDEVLFTVIAEENPEDIKNRRAKLVTTTIVTTLVAFALLICGIGCYRYYKAKAMLRKLNEQEMYEFFRGRPGFAIDFERDLILKEIEALPYNDKFEINNHDVTLDYKCILGIGEFAAVFKGFIASKGLEVAVKVTKNSTDVISFKAILSEVKIMSYLGNHTNVVGLVGVSTSDIRNRNIYIYLDFCELGSMQKYLMANKQNFLDLLDDNGKLSVRHVYKEDHNVSISTLDLIRWSAQIADGMEYLARKSVIHADLAARNVLLTLEKTAKVSDFGLSRKMYECRFYEKKTKCPLPWRWMALETLQTATFSTQSDIWSYGVTLWEMFTLGEIPFQNQKWNSEFVDRLISGVRLDQPEFITSEMYSTIVDCWDTNPSVRPTFGFLKIYFKDILESLVMSAGSTEL